MTARVNLRFDGCLAERTRLARQLHDTLLPTIEGSKLSQTTLWKWTFMTSTHIA